MAADKHAASLKMLTAALIVLLFTGCSDDGASVRQFSADAYPQRLSEWGLFDYSGAQLRLSDGVEAYDLNTPLFTDYAQKLRTVWMPSGSAAQYSSDATFEFPVGTIISKTFFYPMTDTGLVRADFTWPESTRTLSTDAVTLMETRLLVKQASGWDALPYVWQGDDAYLKIAGDLKMLEMSLPDGEAQTFPYIVPSRNQCASCHATNHTTGALKPIGPKARHLNRGYLGRDGNQLLEWQSAGRLQNLPVLEEVAINADFTDNSQFLAARSRAYLDINCGHCHNAQGAADTSGLLLDASVESNRQLGLCKPPIAAGGGTGGRTYSIVPGEPDHSILIYRLETTDPGTMMPELGRSLVHQEGVTLLKDWITSLDGECVEMSSD